MNRHLDYLSEQAYVAENICDAFSFGPPEYNSEEIAFQAHNLRWAIKSFVEAKREEDELKNE